MPTWKGFGYAYSRWRPGLGFVFVFLVLLTSGLHYVVLRMNHSRDARRVVYFTEAARKAASGAKGRRKVRVPMVEGGVGGESLELVVDGDTVLLVSRVPSRKLTSAARGRDVDAPLLARTRAVAVQDVAHPALARRVGQAREEAAQGGV